MSTNQIIWACLISSAIIINLPLIGFVRYLFIAGKINMIITEFQSVLDQINSLVGPVTTLKANSDAGVGTASAQDVTDTVAALKDAVNGLSTAAGVVPQ